MTKKVVLLPNAAAGHDVRPPIPPPPPSRSTRHPTTPPPARPRARSASGVGRRPWTGRRRPLPGRGLWRCRSCRPPWRSSAGRSSTARLGATDGPRAGDRPGSRPPAPWPVGRSRCRRIGPSGCGSGSWGCPGCSRGLGTSYSLPLDQEKGRAGTPESGHVGGVDPAAYAETV